MYFGNTSHGQTFWGNTKSGMSVEAVRSILPSAMTPDKPKTLNGAIENFSQVNYLKDSSGKLLVKSGDVISQRYEITELQCENIK